MAQDNSQKNYFAYNIIDSIYFNSPTGNELQNFYNLSTSGFIRRNEEYINNLDENQRENYDKLEKEFIQAVINKYINDTFNNGSYFGTPTSNKNITYAYFGNNQNFGIELPDMITNINGTHNYKLISAKDIDYDNVILPNSAISRDFNWGGFDLNRRWGNKPIHINNTFELLNVIDYLLCACDNLWNELYKIKYNRNDSVQIWFSKNVKDVQLILESKRLSTNDFRIGHNDDPQTSMITYLDPTKYYTILNNEQDNDINNFGIVTNFYKTPDDINLKFDRKVVDKTNKNIILMNIDPFSKDIENYTSTTSQQVDGNLQSIYAYKIGDELKIFPGSRIEAFIDQNNMEEHPCNIIDFNNKKLKRETYFKYNDSNEQIYYKVYLKFLNIENINNPFIIYYIDESNIKQIISAGYQDMEAQNYCDVTILNNNFSDKESYKYNSSKINNGSNIVFPIFYLIPDEFNSTLEISTPNSSLFSADSQSITIYYYKSSNKLNCKLTRIKNDEEIEIKKEKDQTLENSLSVNNYRYNIPADEEILLTFDATYMGNTDANGNELKLDDEYNDVMINSSVNNYDSYYTLVDIDKDNNYKRNFIEFTNQDAWDNAITFYDNKQNKYKHVWQKIENPYKLEVEIDNDELISQTLTYQEVNNEINTIKTEAELITYEDNKYKFKHTLGPDVEQVKLDLRFNIKETSKVKEVSYIIPLNINKVYSPTINLFTYKATYLENEGNSNKYYNNNENLTLKNLNNVLSKKYGDNGINSFTNTYEKIYGEDIPDLEYLTNQNTYICTYTFNNSYFEFSYSYINNIVNLIGSYFYINNHLNKINKKLVTGTVLVTGGTSYTLKSTDVLFNINGLGRNYRPHGNGNSISAIFERDGIEINQMAPFYKDFDLLSIITPNQDVQIIKDLKFKLTDKSNDTNSSYYQLSIINNTGQWEENKGEFIEGQKNGTNYVIKTLPIDICKTSDKLECKKQYSSAADSVTYYMPITYMYINSTTFYPPIDTLPNPTSHILDLNNSEDLNKYKNYVNCWNDDNNYHPIKLSMKLFENNLIANPYYNESNEAIVEFNIKRSEPGNNITIHGAHKNIMVGLNERYYLSDFIVTNMIDINTQNLKDEILRNSPTGSYMYYDETYKTYLINEIPCNFKVTNNIFNLHNEHYKECEDTDVINEIKLLDGNSDRNKKIIYPIFRKPIIEENGNITYSDTEYNYDIYRISDINKIHFTSFKYEVCGDSDNLIIPNEPQSNLNSGLGIEIPTGNNEINSVVDISSDFINNFGDIKREDSDNYENNYFNHIKLTGIFDKFYNSKNYKGATVTNSDIIAHIYPIIREEKNLSDNLYRKVPFTVNDVTTSYEFFEFKYDNICKLTKDDNSEYSYKYESLAPGKDLDIYEAYKQQLKLFLNSNADEFIASEEYWENIKSNYSSIDSVQTDDSSTDQNR